MLPQAPFLQTLKALPLWRSAMVPFSKILECLTEAPMRAVQIAVRCEAEVGVVRDVCAELISRNWIARDEEAFYFLPRPANVTVH